MHDANPALGKPSAKRRKVTEQLTNLGERSGRNQVVIFADDAQRIAESEYNWLMEIHAELEERDICLGIYFFGQPELLHRRTAFQQAGKRHLLGRFMVHDFAFNGLTDLADIKYCLDGYDTTEYPAGSGWSFTRYFFPEGFATGWRLASLAEDLWEEFMEITAEYAVSPYEEIPMLHFSRTINSILKNIGPSSGADVRISRQQIHELVLASGYVSFRKNGEGTGTDEEQNE